MAEMALLPEMQEGMFVNYTVVTLNKHPELAETLIESIRKTHANQPRIIVVGDNHSEKFGPNVVTIESKQPFCFARNANLGIAAAGRRDVILMNDDTQVLQKDALHILASTAAKFPRIGILSPLIDGGVGNPYQTEKMWRQEFPDVIGIQGESADSMPVCFVCVWLSRRLLDKVGKLDEAMIHYGFDDNDYCIRSRKAGFETAITKLANVQHGSGGTALERGRNWSSSFARVEFFKTNEEYFRTKHAEQIRMSPLL